MAVYIRINAGKAGVPACTVNTSEDACFTRGEMRIVHFHFRTEKNMEWNYFVKCFMSLLAILNPIGALPIYLSIGSGSEWENRRRISIVTTLTVFLTLMAFMLFGESILSFFGIGIPAFRIGGGILIIMIAVSMLQGKMSPAKHTPEETEAMLEKQSIAVVPLAVPILAGPGAISTVILLTHQANSWLLWIALSSAIVANSLLVYLVFFLAGRLNLFLGISGIKIVTRIMGMILMAIAVQFILDGLAQVYPILTTTQ